jgi:hypothetical protein|tara:strand:+ start:41 stop:214 length:174 start_codon:yes stop_codon:yes gene_type:complete
MQVGDLVRVWMNAEYSEVGLIYRIDKRTLPEKVFVQTSAGRLIEDWEDNCEVISAVK